MEIILQWFWILKLLVIFAAGMSFYNWYKSNFKSRKWLAMTIIGIILTFISPVKIDTGTRGTQIKSNMQIESTKELPALIKDDSYTKRKDGIGIKEKDLP